MFTTKHFEGRAVYETDEVVCFNIFVNEGFSRNPSIYLSQILVSLDTYKFAYTPFVFRINGVTVSEEDVVRELKEGVNDYHQTRIKLGLKK